MLPTLQAAIARASSSTGFELLHPLPPPVWPTPTLQRAHIAVLDSSFNPPTRAHLAIAATAFPPIYGNANADVRDDNVAGAQVQIDDPGPYTARLLLYSPRNADKTPSAADASTAQRAEMMIAQASALEQVLSQPEDSQQAFGVGVGLLRAPTFVGKATALAAALSSDSPPALTFLVGTDTLVRIFDTKYYPEGGMPAALEQLFAHAWLVCVSRGDEGDIAAQDALLSDPEVMRWTKAGKVRVLGHLEESAGVSSTLVRAAVQHGRGEVEKYVAPGVADILLRDGLYV